MKTASTEREAIVGEVATKLTEMQRAALLGVEADGNGKHFYQIHGLAKAGLMSLQPIPALLGAKAYRLNDFGKQVRSYIKDQDHGRA